MRLGFFVMAALALAGCATESSKVTNMPSGAAAYGMMQAGQPPAGTTVDYRIGALDAIDVNVFQEPELSVKAIQVDASGSISLPLVGSVSAKGKTTSQLSAEISQALGARYLRNPQVTVTVASSVSQKVSIQGEVVEPGVYQLSGPTTLLDVMSMAKGESEIASLDQVVVFREINGQRMGAVFDVASIRRGQAADPRIQGNDLIVVGFSSARRFWKNILSASPLFNVFRPLVL
jgi:polysaccharide export outer membrane protein